MVLDSFQSKLCFRIKVSTKIWIYSDFGSNIGFYWIAIFKKNYQNCKFS